MKKIILIILLSTLLVSCNEEEINTNNEVVKEDFNITVKNINDFSNDFNLEKT
jgi:PBP1b-binding outer membrane lipoprotein LpoB